MPDIELLASSGAVTATGTTTPAPVPRGNTVGVYVMVTAVSGTSPSCTFTVELSADGANWVPAVASFSAITAAANAVQVVTTPAVLMRLRYTITGTTPSFTFSALAVGQVVGVAQ